MEPTFARRYYVHVRVFKPSGKEKENISYTQSEHVLARDFFDAYQKAQELIKLLVVNNDWRLGEVLSITEEGSLFLGIKLDPVEEVTQSCSEPIGLPDPPILKKGFKGMPCQIHDGDWSV